MNAVTEPLYRLAMPRWAAAPLPEFATAEARAYFTRNKENAIGSFAEHLEKSDEYIDRLNSLLLDLAPLIQSPDAVNGVVSSDDIHLFSTLRAMSIVENVIYPPVVEAYRRQMAQATGVALHDDIATRPVKAH
jgi:glutaredoxin 2